MNDVEFISGCRLVRVLQLCAFADVAHNIVNRPLIGCIKLASSAKAHDCRTSSAEEVARWKLVIMTSSVSNHCTYVTPI